MMTPGVIIILEVWPCNLRAAQKTQTCNVWPHIVRPCLSGRHLDYRSASVTAALLLLQLVMLQQNAAAVTRWRTVYLVDPGGQLNSRSANSRFLWPTRLQSRLRRFAAECRPNCGGLAVRPPVRPHCRHNCGRHVGHKKRQPA